MLGVLHYGTLIDFALFDINSTVWNKFFRSEQDDEILVQIFADGTLDSIGRKHYTTKIEA